MAIKLLILDVDGTLTDGKLHISANGEVMKSFNAKDGLGIKKLAHYEITPVIITGRSSEIVSYRANELGIKEVYQGIDDKEPVVKNLMAKHSLNFNQVAYIGDDENDLYAMQLCGLKACPADAVSIIKQAADYICTRNGGDGAVREFIEYIIGN